MPNTPDKNEKPEDELTQQSLESKLRSYHDAMRSEFEIAEKAKDEAGAQKAVNEFLREHVPVALANIVYLMQHSTSDSVRLSASKTVINEVLKGELGAGDPVEELINSLKAGKSKTPAE